MNADTKEEPLLEENPKAMSSEEIRRILRQRELDAIETPPGAAPRNTYKAAHAHKLKPYFIKACDEHKDVCIPYHEFSCKAKRMHAIICDSLLWLIHNDIENQTKWATFKTQINFRISPDADEGIWIEWRKFGSTGSRGRMPNIPGISKPSEQNVDYMDKLVAWIEGDRTHLLRIEGLNLSLEKQQAAIKMFEAAGITEYRVEPNRIIAV